VTRCVCKNDTWKFHKKAINHIYFLYYIHLLTFNLTIYSHWVFLGDMWSLVQIQSPRPILSEISNLLLLYSSQRKSLKYMWSWPPFYCDFTCWNKHLQAVAISQSTVNSTVVYQMCTTCADNLSNARKSVPLFIQSEIRLLNQFNVQFTLWVLTFTSSSQPNENRSISPELHQSHSFPPLWIAPSSDPYALVQLPWKRVLL
jgi:hypothetical protein